MCVCSLMFVLLMTELLKAHISKGNSQTVLEMWADLIWMTHLMNGSNIKAATCSTLCMLCLSVPFSFITHCFIGNYLATEFFVIAPQLSAPIILTCFREREITRWDVWLQYVLHSHGSLAYYARKQAGFVWCDLKFYHDNRDPVQDFH